VWLFNAGLALNGRDSRWQLTVDCQNCFNTDYVQSQITGYSFLNPPRTWSVRARYRF
jgi:iron complex outermembrane receptor protein